MVEKHFDKRFCWTSIGQVCCHTIYKIYQTAFTVSHYYCDEIATAGYSSHEMNVNSTIHSKCESCWDADGLLDCNIQFMFAHSFSSLLAAKNKRQFYQADCRWPLGRMNEQQSQTKTNILCDERKIIKSNCFYSRFKVKVAVVCSLIEKCYYSHQQKINLSFCLYCNFELSIGWMFISIPIQYQYLLLSSVCLSVRQSAYLMLYMFFILFDCSPVLELQRERSEEQETSSIFS